MRTLPALLTCGLVLAACAPAAAPGPAATPVPEPSATPGAPADAAVLAVADEMMMRMVEWSPEIATYLGLPFPVHDRITDPSLEAIAARQAQQDRWREQLAAVDPEAIGERQTRVLLGTLRHHLDSDAATRVCRQELWGVSQLFGWQVQYPQLAQVQPVGDASQREAALARFSELPRYIDTEIANLREGSSSATRRRGSTWSASSSRSTTCSRRRSGDSPFAVLLAARADARRSRRRSRPWSPSGSTPPCAATATFLADEYLPGGADVGRRLRAAGRGGVLRGAHGRLHDAPPVGARDARDGTAGDGRDPRGDA
jgi:uncharacterized protein (DUF885 family)